MAASQSPMKVHQFVSGLPRYVTWFIYWMQNLPGRGNGVLYRGRALTNWWAFIGDWDGAMGSGRRLVE
jgi:hypothetical protein